MIPYGRQSIGPKDSSAVLKVLKSDWLTQGPEIGRFEAALAKACGARFAAAFNSGTAALHAAYFAAGLKQGDELIVPSITFAATANAGLYLGARPVFADVEPDTGNADPRSIEARLTKKTRLIAPVHYAGHPADMEAIAEIARGRGLRVVEDACHALGARYRDKGGRWVKAGSCAHSDLSALSFHPVKHITTGEGGAATTNDPDLYERLKIFRNHGITREPGLFQGDGLDRGAGWYYEMLHLGFNYRISDMQAALGSSQLKRLGEFVARRRFIAGHYREAFGANPFFDLPPEREGYESSYHLYPIRIKEPFVPLRRAVFDELRARGIGAQVHYIPVHLQPYYRGLGFEPGLCPAAEGFYSREISLPMFPALRDSDLKKVVRIVLAAFRKVCGPIREGR